MNYLTRQLLNSEELEILRANLQKKSLSWEDGKLTAGKQASRVKNNLQLRRDSDLSKKFSTLITKKILSNELIKSFALPKKVHGTIFAKSTKGMGYGRHIDNAYMYSGRADLSFTVFINCKDNYEGGEFAMLDETYKPEVKQGSVIVFPSNFMYDHEVKKVTKGNSYSVMTWIM